MRIRASGRTMPTMDEDLIKKATTEIQKRIITGALDVATPQFIRAYWRANAHKLMTFAENRIPQEVRGSGEDGEIVHRVIHSIRQSPLDELPQDHRVESERLQAPRIIEGEKIG